MNYLQLHPQPCDCGFCGAQREAEKSSRVKIDGNEPAFPVHPQCSGQPCGISIRALLAAIAMNGLLSSGVWNMQPGDDETLDERLSKESIKSADALLKELNK